MLAVRARRPIGLVVCWVHAVVPDGPARVARHAAPDAFCWVCSSASADPARDTPEPAWPDRCAIRRVILGFVREDAQSRWLTHEEIASGVLGAIDGGIPGPDLVVGQVTPWADRPGVG